MDIRQLNYFLATVDFGNMTRAAEFLHIAQPALSQQIAGLERELGSKLLVRSVRGVLPTSAGKLLYRHAKGIMRDVEDLRGAVSFQKQHPSGRVAVGIPGSTARLLTVPMLAALQTYPGILLEIVERPSSELTGLIAQGNLDMTIAIDALPQRGVKIQPLFHEELYAILPEAVGRKRLTGITLDELGKLPLVLPSAPSTIRTRLDLAFLDANIRYPLAAEISATDLLLHIVQNANLCTVLPWAAVHLEVSQKRLHAVPLRPQAIKREVSLCLSQDVHLSDAGEIVHGLVIDILEKFFQSGQWKGVERVRHSSR